MCAKILKTSASQYATSGVIKRGCQEDGENGEISEDESRRTQDEIQEMTNKYIEEIDSLLAQKEKEIMEV